MTIPEEKRALRRSIRSQLRALPGDRRTMLDAALCHSVLAHPWVQAADSILLYCSVYPEPDTRALITALLAQGKRIFLPKCGEGSSMQFYRITGLDDGSVFPGAYDIPEPTGQEMPVLTECSLCIVPGVAFTAEGSRLGQGGGYYDRWLRAHPDLRTLAMTYAHLIQERIPCEAHDCRVDAVITEQYQGG